MKTLIFILLVYPLMGQEIPKKANLAIIKHEQFDNVDLFQVCCFILRDKGYRFEKMDMDSLMIITHPRNCSNKHNFLVYHKFDLSVSGNEVTIKSFALSNRGDPRADLWIFDDNWIRGEKRWTNSIGWHGFQHLQIISAILANELAGDLLYVRE